MGSDSDMIWIQTAVGLYGKSRWWIERWCTTYMVGRRRCVSKNDLEEVISTYMTPKEVIKHSVTNKGTEQ